MVALILICKCFYVEPPLSKKLKLLKGNSSKSEETSMFSKVRCQKLTDSWQTWKKAMLMLLSVAGHGKILVQ